MTKLSRFQMTQNEAYFERALSLLCEGGVFGWKDLGEVLIRHGNKFQASQKSIGRIKRNSYERVL